MPYPYIAIEGVIGVGKTTLARYLQEALSAELLLEVFEENPFLSDFYADRSRYAFQTQIFFLLSRYRQQHQVIPNTIKHSPLVSDYLFAKDWLFAHLNLVNDELTVYESVYSALAERIPAPTLVVYLKASVDTLMDRIAVRDRPYERNMERDYIAALSAAYDDLFADFSQAPVLTIATDNLNIVNDLDARQQVIGQIKSTLESGATQPSLLNGSADTPQLSAIFADDTNRRLPDFQQFHHALDRAKHFSTDLYLNYMKLFEEMGELSETMARVRHAQLKHTATGTDESAALRQALAAHRDGLQQEMADVLAYLLKLANYTGIDLEAAYLQKMDTNVNREWHSGTTGVEAE